MPLDEGLLREAQAAADGWADAQQQASQAKDAYHQTVRRLYLTGASMREIAEALGLSHQRVHQIIETSGGTAGWKPRSGTGLACSFCGATRSDVKYLVAGPGVYVCEACVALARQVVREADEQNRPRTHLDPLPANSGLGCSFCAKTDGRRLVAGPGVRICDECLEFCAEVIAAQAS
jgi:ClpX C4-type zinc finger protein